MSDASLHYGLMGEFDNAEALRDAAAAVRQRGYRAVEAFSPFPIDGLAEILGHKRDWIPFWMLLGGVLGALLSYFLQYYSAVHAYPLNIGGRPLHSWPAFLPLSIEFTIAGAAAFASLALLIGDRLPKLYHPVFNVSRFEHASRDAFFLCILAADDQFDGHETAVLLRELGARQVSEVPR